MADWDRQLKDATKLLRQGDAAAALRLLLPLLGQVDAPAAAYDGVVVMAERAAKSLPEPRLSASLALYRRDFPAARERLARDRFPGEHAQVLAYSGEHAAAAVLFESVGRPVLAARAYALAGQRRDVERCYRLLLASERSLGPYEQALIHCQLAVLLQSPAASRSPEGQRHAVAAQQILETLADEHEANGEVERALDCNRLYIQLGQALGRFENVAEGYVNCLRLLKAEQRPLDVLRHYEAFLAQCAEPRVAEYHLAAAQCREAADYLERWELPYSSIYRRRTAELYVRAADHQKALGGAVEIAESAYLQAIAAYNALYDFSAIGEVFTKMAALFAKTGDSVDAQPPDAARQERYQTLAARYAKVSADAAFAERADAAPTLPPYVTEPLVAPPIWELDLIEWQAKGEPATVCLGLVADAHRPLLTRRNALLVLLYEYLTPTSTTPMSLVDEGLAIERGRRTVEALAGLRCYEALRPLERLYSEEPALRRAIVESLPRLPFSRAVALLLRGLADADANVYGATLEALTRTHFPEAVHPLCRSYRSQGSAAALEVRRAILTALARSRDPRGRELIAEVAVQGMEPLRSDAQRMLQFADPEFASTRPG